MTPLYAGREQVSVRAGARECFDALTDYERLPEWQGPVKRCSVLSRDHAGRGREVEYEVDVRVRSVSYRLIHHYEEPHRVWSDYAGGVFECLDGEWTFEDAGDETVVSFALRIDPGRLIPGPVARMLRRQVLRRSVQDLKRHVERSSR